MVLYHILPLLISGVVYCQLGPPPPPACQNALMTLAMDIITKNNTKLLHDVLPFT
jgi:hypothetical protein